MERLREDLYLLSNLTSYLERAVAYEEQHKYCCENKQLLEQAQQMLDILIAALASLTNTQQTADIRGNNTEGNIEVWAIKLVHNMGYIAHRLYFTDRVKLRDDAVEL